LYIAGAPHAPSRVARPADHHASAEAAADANRHFHRRGNDHDAFGLLEEFLGDVLRKLTARQIVTGTSVAVPESGRHLVAVLQRYAPRNESKKTIQ
jgi:hypothetical protein